MENLAIIILAAGKGTRMGAQLPKVLFETREKVLLEHVLSTASSLNPQKLVVVTGYQREKVEQSALSGNWLKNFERKNLSFAVQEKQLGTGDAVKSALKELKGFVGTVLILYGDVPLIEPQTLQSLLSKHNSLRATLSLIVLKGHLDNSYGKIIRDQSGNIQKITELRDCTDEQKVIDETNVGIYAVDSAFLEPAIESLQNDNNQKEYYLTDILEKAVKEGQTVASIVITDAFQAQGVNTPWDLQIINNYLRQKQIKNFVVSGVIFDDPNSAYIDINVQIAAGVRIGPNTIIKGNTSIATGCVIEGTCFLKDCILEENAHIRFGVRAEGAKFGSGSGAGPFAHLRATTELGENVHIGNFVEIKNSTIAKGTKAGHLAYLGDASIAENVNIGAGTIIANYDGVNKHKTVIENSAFIGSNSVLVAPIEIGANSTVGAGSVITKTVEPDSLAVTRAQLKVKKGWQRPKKNKS